VGDADMLGVDDALDEADLEHLQREEARVRAWGGWEAEETGNSGIRGKKKQRPWHCGARSTVKGSGRQSGKAMGDAKRKQRREME